MFSVLLEHFVLHAKLPYCSLSYGLHLQVDAIIVAVFSISMYALVVVFDCRLTAADGIT